MYRKVFKRMFDIVFSFLALVIISPIMLIVAIIIKLTSKGPAIFKQERIGRNRKVFVLYKFRTMTVDTPKNMPTYMLDNATVHITKVGKFLRNTSIDELPQLVNILRGDMSLIGYRPVVASETLLNDEREKLGVFALRPGISGLAQTKGRDNLDFRRKANYDAIYVRRCSFLFDMYLFFRTFLYVLQKKGVQEGKNERLEKKVESVESKEQKTLNKPIEISQSSRVDDAI